MCKLKLAAILLLVVSYNDIAGSQSEYLRLRQKQLREVRDIYEGNIKYNFTYLQNYLSTQEVQNLRGTQVYMTLDDEILHAYAVNYPRSIRISAATILFLDELAITHAWYDYKGNRDLQPIYNYTLLLRKHYKKPELRRTPIPTLPEALGVPYQRIWNAPDENEIKKVTRNYLNSATIFILAHEMGHIALKHTCGPSMSPAQSRRIEAEADEFAMKLMAKIGLPPAGMVVTMSYYSLLYPIRFEFGSEERWKEHLIESSHPIWPERLQNLAHLFRRYSKKWHLPSSRTEQMAGWLDKIAELLLSQDVLASVVLGSKNLTFDKIMTYDPFQNIDAKYFLN